MKEKKLQKLLKKIKKIDDYEELSLIYNEAKNARLKLKWDDLSQNPYMKRGKEILTKIETEFDNIKKTHDKLINKLDLNEYRNEE